MGRKVKSHKTTGWTKEENQDIVNLLFHHRGMKKPERLYREARIHKSYREKAGIDTYGAQIVSPERLSQQYRQHQEKYKGTRRRYRTNEEDWIERQYREAINMMDNRINWSDACSLNALWVHASAENVAQVAQRYPEIKTTLIAGVLVSNIGPDFFRSHVTQEDVNRINEIYQNEGPEGAFVELLNTLLSR